MESPGGLPKLYVGAVTSPRTYIMEYYLYGGNEKKPWTGYTSIEAVFNNQNIPFIKGTYTLKLYEANSNSYVIENNNTLIVNRASVVTWFECNVSTLGVEGDGGYYLLSGQILESPHQNTIDYGNGFD